MGIAKIAGKIIDDLAKLMGKDIISLGDAAVGDVKSGKTFYAGSTTLKTGTLPTKAIVAGSDLYEEGYHAGNPGGLDAIDTDLAPGNIKKDVNIFGKEGTYEAPAPTVTLRDVTEDIVCEADWTEVLSVNIPASAKKVIIVGTAETGATTPGYVRVLYDGVEKDSKELAVANKQGFAKWAGDGLGSDALASVEAKGYLDAGGIAYSVE